MSFYPNNSYTNRNFYKKRNRNFGKTFPWVNRNPPIYQQPGRFDRPYYNNNQFLTNQQPSQNELTHNNSLYNRNVYNNQKEQDSTYILLQLPKNIQNTNDRNPATIDLETKLNTSTVTIKNPNNVCTNPNCDHLETTKVKLFEMNKISTIDHLIMLGKTYHCKTNKTYYNINLRVLYNLIETLTCINNMIGLHDIKSRIVDQILYFLQGYHNKGRKCNVCIDCQLGITCMKNQNDMFHTVLTGPPGVGKTCLGRLLGIVYNKLEILASDKFTVVSRSDLIGQYLGESAIKTQKCIDNADGGVLFIDEAYSLGNTEKRDFYSKECIDILTKNLSEKKTFICIIAGYKNALDECFFAHNNGLDRRFPFRYDLPSYKIDELKKIFKYKVKQDKFQIESEEEIEKLFTNEQIQFKNNGGDMEILYLKSKLAHCRNITIAPIKQFILTTNDIKNGFKDFNDIKKNDGRYMNMYA